MEQPRTIVTDPLTIGGINFGGRRAIASSAVA